MSDQDYFSKDYYKVLGLTKSASDQDIKKAFRKLSQKYHPDVNKNNASAEAKYKEITEANTVLSNKKERAKYDQIRAMSGGGAHFTGGSNGGFEDLFGGGGFGGFAGGSRGTNSSFGGFSDIFSGMFGGGQSQRQSYDPFGGYGSQSGYSPQNQSPTAPVFDKVYKVKLVNALFGAKLKHKFKDGSEVIFKIPSGTQSGKVLNIKNSNGKSEKVRIEVTMPDLSKLNDKQTAQLRELLG